MNAAWLALPFALLGGLLGRAFFATLRRGVACLGGGAGIWRVLALAGIRFVAALGVFALAAQFGAVSTLATLLGFLLARGMALRRYREVA